MSSKVASYCHLTFIYIASDKLFIVIFVKDFSHTPFRLFHSS
jgi:hypothetical protein